MAIFGTGFGKVFAKYTAKDSTYRYWLFTLGSWEI